MLGRATGGLNALVVDSSALAEQVVGDVIAGREANPESRDSGSGARACPQLSQMTAAAKWMPARKFLAVLS